MKFIAAVYFSILLFPFLCKDRPKSPEQLIGNQLESLNESLPVEFDDGATLNKISHKPGDDIIFRFDLTQDLAESKPLSELELQLRNQYLEYPCTLEIGKTMVDTQTHADLEFYGPNDRLLVLVETWFVTCDEDAPVITVE